MNNVFRRGRAWVKCYSCNVFYYYFLDADENELNGEVAKLLGNLEFPGQGYKSPTKKTLGEEEEDLAPLIDHYLQNFNCSFIQNALRTTEAKMETFPDNWVEKHGLR